MVRDRKLSRGVCKAIPIRIFIGSFLPATWSVYLGTLLRTVWLIYAFHFEAYSVDGFTTAIDKSSALHSM